MRSRPGCGADPVLPSAGAEIAHRRRLFRTARRAEVELGNGALSRPRSPRRWRSIPASLTGFVWAPFVREQDLCDILAERLATDLGKGTLQPFDALVLVTRSMGGLVVQKALIDWPRLAERTRAIVLFGTPSAGLVKARTLEFWKRQLAAMGKAPFITALRADWAPGLPHGPFKLLAVGGERDQFVPPGPKPPRSGGMR
jgi:pimeloyl-ACP methyl ester carboxylesterase